MTILENLKSRITNKSRFQDVVFIISIFIFSAILVLGLFPRTEIDERSGRISFIYLMMIIPIVVAIYFIIISFRRKLYSDKSEISSSITFKIGLAFVFVAILSSLPIIIISNNIINTTISELITEKTEFAFEESLNMSNDIIENNYEDIKGELNSLDFSLSNGKWSLTSIKNREYISTVNQEKGYNTIFYKIINQNNTNNSIVRIDGGIFDDDYYPGITNFFQNTDIKPGDSINNISINDISILVGNLFIDDYLTVIYKIIPEKVYDRIAVFEESLNHYKRREFLKPYLEIGAGIFLLFLAILIIVIAISASFFLSRNITRPVLELVDAARDVASGRFDVHLYRDSSDELTLLFSSFSRMVMQLDESRRVMYKTQKLEAWREVAERLIHEIKNPLTPIRLSAERIQRKFNEGHPEVEEIVRMGTETIIEEVKVLTEILSEFSKFARLPEMKPEFQNINSKIDNCVNFFLGHEKITFHVNLDDSIPDIYIDKILIRQALTNIIQNAVDAVGDNGNIYIESELIKNTEKNNVRIRIKDDGVGINENDINRVFEPTFSTKENGTGIGLAIVEKIILEHSGKIYCNSVYGLGTEFIIDLPIFSREVVLNGKDLSS